MHCYLYIHAVTQSAMLTVVLSANHRTAIPTPVWAEANRSSGSPAHAGQRQTRWQAGNFRQVFGQIRLQAVNSRQVFGQTGLQAGNSSQVLGQTSLVILITNHRRRFCLRWAPAE